MSDDRYERGLALFHEMHDAAAAKMASELGAVSPDMMRYAAEYPFGDLYNRKGLDIKIRQAATIASLASIGGAESQLKIHIGIGLNIGLSKQEIVETLIQISVYAGFPRAVNALMAAKAVFEEADKQAEMAE